MGNPIWGTAESESWCRGFDYKDYVDIYCKHMNVDPLSEPFYKELCMCFENQMERDIGWHTKKDETE